MKDVDIKLDSKVNPTKLDINIKIANDDKRSYGSERAAPVTKNIVNKTEIVNVQNHSTVNKSVNNTLQSSMDLSASLSGVQGSISGINSSLGQSSIEIQKMANMLRGLSEVKIQPLTQDSLGLPEMNFMGLEQSIETLDSTLQQLSSTWQSTASIFETTGIDLFTEKIVALPNLFESMQKSSQMFKDVGRLKYA